MLQVIGFLINVAQLVMIAAVQQVNHVMLRLESVFVNAQMEHLTVNVQ